MKNFAKKLAAVLALGLAAASFGAPVAQAQGLAPGAEIYHVGGPNATQPSSVVSHVLYGSELRSNTAPASDGTVGTGTSDIPSIDYSGIFTSVKGQMIALLLVVATISIGLTAMFGGFKWIGRTVSKITAGRSA